MAAAYGEPYHGVAAGVNIAGMAIMAASWQWHGMA